MRCRSLPSGKLNMMSSIFIRGIQRTTSVHQLVKSAIIDEPLYRDFYHIRGTSRKIGPADDHELMVLCSEERIAGYHARAFGKLAKMCKTMPIGAQVHRILEWEAQMFPDDCGQVANRVLDKIGNRHVQQYITSTFSHRRYFGMLSHKRYAHHIQRTCEL
jgi:hypothetical protein